MKHRDDRSLGENVVLTIAGSVTCSSGRTITASTMAGPVTDAPIRCGTRTGDGDPVRRKSKRANTVGWRHPGDAPGSREQRRARAVSEERGLPGNPHGTRVRGGTEALLHSNEEAVLGRSDGHPGHPEGGQPTV